MRDISPAVNDGWHLTDPDAWADVKDAMRDEPPVTELGGLWPVPGFPPYISTDGLTLRCDVTDADKLDGVDSVVCDGWGGAVVTFTDGRVAGYRSSDTLEVTE